MGKLRNLPARFGRAPRRVPALPKKADRFYLTNEWRKLVARLKEERGNWCNRCGASGAGGRIIGDHIHEIKDGGERLDADNVELLCQGCHNAKTAAAKAVRVKGGGG